MQRPGFAAVLFYGRGRPEQAARANLRRVLANLRQILGLPQHDIGAAADQMRGSATPGLELWLHEHPTPWAPLSVDAELGLWLQPRDLRNDADALDATQEAPILGFGLNTFTSGLIMGLDNLHTFPKWKNSEVILRDYEIYVYPRVSEKKDLPELLNHEKVHLIDAPIVEISSTFIRKAVKDQKDIRALMPFKAWKYMDEMNFYK